MKPLYMKISAFGPYKGEEEVDFRSFLGGVFLITGDTGSGKTSVFDAISFALYGEASGNIRSSSMMRSDFAKEDTETFVELLFENHGKEYWVRRSPEYLRAKKRGEGYTKKSADAVLKCPDGRVVHKYQQVTAEIIEILGITKEQFNNIAMIAQGDFMRLILAKSEERSKIFRDIFDTHAYLNLQSGLKQEMFNRMGENKDYENSIFQYENDTLCDDKSRYNEEYMSLIKNKNINEVPRFIEIMDKIIQEDREFHTKQMNEKLSHDKLSELINEYLELEKNSEKFKRSQEDKNLTMQDNLERIRQIEADIKNHAAGKTEREKSFEKLTYLKSKLEEYDILDGKLLAKKAYEDDIKQKKEAFDKITKEETEKEEKRNVLSGIKERYEKGKVEKAGIELQLNQLEETDRILSVIIERKEHIIQYEENLSGEQEVYLRQEQELNNINKESVRVSELFMRNQAGIMADRLADGEPCPVCGSKVHPSKAELLTETATWEEVKRLKKESEKAAKLCEKSAGNCSCIRGILEQEKMELEKDIAKYNEKEYPDKACQALDDGKDIQKDKELRRKLDDRINLLKKEKEEWDGFMAKHHTITEQINQITEQQNSLSGKKKEIEKNIQEKQVGLAGLRAEIESLKKNLNFETKKEALNEVKELEQCINMYDNKMEKLKTELEMRKNKNSADEAELNVIRENKRDNEKKEKRIFEEIKKKCPDMEGLNQEISREMMREEIKRAIRDKKAEAEKESAKLAKEAGEAEFRIRTNQSSLKKLKTVIGKRESALNEYLRYRKLSDVANGTIQGREKLTFERYVQGTYFEYIILAANKRLAIMTEGRYELIKRRETGLRNQSGLELDVKDAYTGKVRSVNTLSGGEAFKASLSMALGLSDVVQGYAGGIRLDSMFIDEGFGSLDEESLDKAIDILSELSGKNRMIGIISHVSALKNRIEKKIEITKTINGSTIKIL